MTNKAKLYTAYALISLALLSAIITLFYYKWDWMLAHEDLAAGLVTSAILTLALIFTGWTLRNMRQDRSTGIAMGLNTQYESGALLEARQIYHRIKTKQKALKLSDRPKSFMNTVNYYRKYYPDEFVKLTSMPAFFDNTGWLVRHKCCDPETIGDLIDIVEPYELWEPYIKQEQGKEITEKPSDDPSALYGNFVWLYRFLRPRQEPKNTIA
jgi:hypothetical protein